jgi:hypothetical protein
VKQGQPLRCGDLDVATDSVLWKLRRAQDERFFQRR